MAHYPRLDFTGSDFDSIRADIIARIQKVFPQWTDTSAANPGMTLADCLTFIGDLIRYFQDRQVNESLLITAVERANIIRHLAMIGYTLATAQPATASLVWALSATQATSVVINQGDVVSTEDGSQSFEVSQRLEIPAGNLTGTVDAVQGSTITESLGPSDGTAGQAFTLGQVPYIFGSEEITVNGIGWTYVSNFLSSSGAAQVYTVAVDAFDQATITFGDGVNGAIPGPGAQISSSYRIGGGSSGNVDAGTITNPALSYSTVAGLAVTISVTNPAAAADGTDRETNQHGQLFGPLSLSAQDRSVSDRDFETNAALVAGVARALAQTSDDDPTIDNNTVLVQVVPTGAGAPTPTLLANVRTQLEVTKPKTNTSKVLVAPALYVDLAPTGTFYVARSQQGQTILRPTLEATGDAFIAALQTFFNPLNVDTTTGRFTVNFGTLIPLSKLYKIAESIQGDDINPQVGICSYFDLVSPVADINVPAKRFPRLSPYTKTILAGPPIQIVYTWILTGGQIIVQQEP